jgi:hypothetical protein
VDAMHKIHFAHFHLAFFLHGFYALMALAICYLRLLFFFVLEAISSTIPAKPGLELAKMELLSSAPSTF